MMARRGFGRLQILTPVWGKWHIDAFLGLNVPSLLAPGNIPALVAALDVVITIVTARADGNTLDAAPAVARLRQHAQVEIKVIDGLETMAPVEAQHYVYRVIEGGENSNEPRYLMFGPPDVIWSDHSFDYIAKKIAAGKNIFFNIFPRVVSNTFIPAFRQKFLKGQSVVSVRGDQLVELAVHHISPIMAATLRSSHNFPLHIENIHWAVPRQGMLLRVFARELFIYDTAKVKLGTNILPTIVESNSDPEFCEDSDFCLGVSLAEFGKETNYFHNRNTASPTQVAYWWCHYRGHHESFISGRKIFWHYGPIDRSMWRGVELASDLFVRRTIVTREGFLVLQALRNQGSALRVGELVAAAIYSGALSRATASIRPPGHLVIFIPKDETFSQGDMAEAFGGDGVANEGALLAFLRAHVCLGEIDFRGRNSVTVQTCDGGQHTITISTSGMQVTDATGLHAPVMVDTTDIVQGMYRYTLVYIQGRLERSGKRATPGGVPLENGWCEGAI